MSDRTPDESTILQFRHILEQHNLGSTIMQIVNNQIHAAGLHLVKGCIVDASFVEAPTSTKNQTLEILKWLQAKREKRGILV